MSHLDDIIRVPVDVVGDIAYILGSDSGDVGTLCKSQSVNMWAKYKPVRKNIVDTSAQLDSNDMWRSDATWWKGQGSNNLCSFEIPYYGGVSELAGDSDSTWEYLKPAGDSTQPYRVADFIGYNHDAEIPFTVYLPSSISVSSAVASAKLTLKSAATLPDYNILLTDIGNFASMYFGVVVVKGAQAYIKTNDSTIGSGQGTYVISLQGCPLIASVGQVELFGVLCTHSATSWTDDYDYEIWSLNAESGVAYKQAQIIQPASNTYNIVISIPNLADAGCWRGEGSASYVSGNISCQFTQINDMSSDYDLSAVDWNVERHSDSEIIKSGSLVSLSNVELTYLDARPGGSSTFTFYAPAEWGTLPQLEDPTDYYIITYTFDYV